MRPHRARHKAIFTVYGCPVFVALTTMAAFLWYSADRHTMGDIAVGLRSAWMVLLLRVGDAGSRKLISLLFAPRRSFVFTMAGQGLRVESNSLLRHPKVARRDRFLPQPSALFVHWAERSSVAKRAYLVPGRIRDMLCENTRWLSRFASEPRSHLL